MSESAPIKRYAVRSFWLFMRRYPFNLGLTWFSFLISNVAIALIPIFIGKLTGALSANPIDKDAAITYTIILIVLSSAHDLLWRIAELVFLRFIKPMSYNYENIMFERVISQPYPYFVDKFTGKVASYITTISQEFQEFLDNMFYNYVNHVVAFFGFAIILSSINWQTGLIFFVGVGAMFVVGRKALTNSFMKEQLVTDSTSTKNGKIVDIISNFLNVKSFRTEAPEIRLIHKEQSKTFAAAKKSYIASVIFWALMSLFVRHLIWPITIAMNVYLFLHGQLSLAEFTTMISAVLLFTATVWDTIWDISQFNLKMARAEEAHYYLFGPRVLAQTSSQEQTSKQLSFNSALRMQDLHFAYPDKPKKNVLYDINLTITKGEKIGVVGKSGGGKTTLTKLLLDYYDIMENSLFIDEQLVTTGQVSQLISYVPQDTSLFHRTIAENIAYATERDVTRDEIIQAAKSAHAHEFIKDIADGYDALVGERGVKLSAGQRQRIAIARALLDDKPILVLDEATSALDSESEVLVQKALETLWHDKTVIVIAHRLSTLRQMDRIIVMEKGQIIEQGTHESLLKQKGVYAKLWQHQSGGFLEE